jgi:hypothetical protein
MSDENSIRIAQLKSKISNNKDILVRLKAAEVHYRSLGLTQFADGLKLAQEIAQVDGYKNIAINWYNVI